jgi:cytochrome c-type biogenesis protein CcmH
VKRLATIGALALALVAPTTASASEQHPTLNELENEVMCPVCNTTLAQSDSDAARSIERVIRDEIASGWTKSRIKNSLVDQYGPAILAAPPKHGFDLLAWVLPLAGIGVAAALLGVAAWRWSRSRVDEVPVLATSSNGRGRVDPALERRLDDELARFD